LELYNTDTTKIRMFNAIKSGSFFDSSQKNATVGVAYSSSGVPIQDQPYISSAAPQQAVTAESVEQGTTFCGYTSYGSPDIPHVMLLRVAGILCVIFSTIELGLGGSLYTYFSNIRAGAWWSVVLVILSGLLSLKVPSRQRVSFICMVSSVGVVIAVIGAISDGSGSAIIRSLTACGEQYSDRPQSFYGKVEDYDNPRKCMKTAMDAGKLLNNSCYCSDSRGMYIVFMYIYENTYVYTLYSYV
jgi:hypothetical protein